MPTTPSLPVFATMRRRSGRRVRTVILVALAAASAGGCANQSSQTMPQEQPILTGLGADACRPDRFASAWQDRTSVAGTSAPLPGPVGGTGGS